MKVVRCFGVLIVVTFLASNLFAAEVVVKAAPTLTVKEPAATLTTVKEPVAAPAIIAPTPAIKEPTAPVTVKEPTIAPAVKEPVMAAPTVKAPTVAPAIREPVAAPAIKTPTLAPAIKEPVVKSPTNVQIKEPVAGIKDPGLMGVRGEQMMGAGKVDSLGGKGLEGIGPGTGLRDGLGLPGGGGKGMDLSDPASALGSGRPGAGMDRGSLGSQFGLGGAENPRGAPSLGGKSVSNPFQGLGGGPGNSMMDGESGSSGSGSWTGKTEWTDKQSSKNGEERTDISGKESYEMEDGSTLEVTTEWNSEDGGTQHAVLRDSDGNVVAEETTDLEPSADAGNSGNDSGGGDAGGDDQDADSSGDYTAGNDSSGGDDSGGSDSGGSSGGNVETNAQPSQQGTATTPNPEDGDGELPPEMQAMVTRMLMRAGTPQVDKQSTLIDPGSDAQPGGGNVMKGELSESGRLNPYINPDPEGGGEVISGGEHVDVGSPGGSLINPGGAVPMTPGQP